MKKAKSNPDSSRLRVLILEDNPADAELVKRELRRAGIVFTSRLVEGKREYSKALADFLPQVILSDFKLPRFNGLAALEITRLLAPDTPFIFISGSIGEEKAIETLALGASDYIFKDNLQRLGPAVQRVVEETRLKLEKKNTNEELRRHVDELRLLAEAADRFVQINDLDEIYDYLTKVISEISGADYLLLSLYDEKLQAIRPKMVSGFEPFQETIRRRFHIDLMEMVFYFKDMRQDDFSDFVSRRFMPVRDGLYGLANRKIPRSICRLIEKLLAVGSMHTMGFSWENQLFGGLTVFFKKANELKNASQIEAIANLAAVSIKRLLAEQALRESEKKYRTLVTQSPDGIFVIDLQGNFLSVNQAMCAGLKYSEEEFLSLKIWDIVPEQYMDLHKKRLAAILKGKEINEAAEYMVRGKDGETHYVAILSTPFYKDNTLIGFQGIARDISESKKMEIRLRESEEYYRILVETSPDAIIIVDAGACVTFASSKAHEIFGIPAQIPIIGVSLLDFVEPGEIPRVQERMVEILSGQSLPQINEYRLLKQDHQLFWGEVSSAPLRDAAGRSIGLLIVCRDISERKRAESQREAALEELRISAEKWQSTFNSITDIVSVISPDHMFLEINKAGCDAMGLKREDIIGKKCYELVHNLHQPLVGCPCSLTKQTKKMEVNEVFENGRYYQLTAWPILDANGELLAFSHTVKDISERKRAEEQIRASLKEKEVLLQEIHHRVKNNLQIISGLLTLQADQSAGKSLAEIFQASQDRIHSIALIHEKLYKSHNLAEIAFDEYLHALTENLFRSLGVAACHITARYEMEPILFTIEKAIPLGLIVNELITNALKYAFPAGRQGEICITLHECRDKSRLVPTDQHRSSAYPGCSHYDFNQPSEPLKSSSETITDRGGSGRSATEGGRAPIYELIVADNGVGLPAGQIPEQQKSLSMKLVSMLAKQIQAELKVKTGPGTEFRLLFSGLPANETAKDKEHGG